MIRNLKTLGLALVAVFAMSAVVATTALAKANGELTPDDSFLLILEGEGIPGSANAFTSLGQTISCNESAYSGELEEASPEFTLTPTYSGCKSGERAATVTMNECDYLFHSATDTTPNGEATPSTWTVNTDFVCPVGKQVEIHVYNGPGHTNTWCTLTIGAQENLTGLTAHVTSPDIKLTGTVTKVASQTHGTCSAGLTINNNSTLDTAITVRGTTYQGLDIG